MQGDLVVNNGVSATSATFENAIIREISSDTLTVKDIIVTGTIQGLNVSNVMGEGTLNLGAPDKDGSWRLRIDNEQLFFEKLCDGEWETKQCIE